MMKYVIIVIVVMLSFLVAPPAFASFCRTWDGHQICILSINRSAKNYWEYKAVVSVDGVTRPNEIYNCRKRVKVQPDGSVLPFEHKDPGELICRILRLSANSIDNSSTALTLSGRRSRKAQHL